MRQIQFVLILKKIPINFDQQTIYKFYCSVRFRTHFLTQAIMNEKRLALKARYFTSYYVNVNDEIVQVSW